jgi:hypothetical protein
LRSSENQYPLLLELREVAGMEQPIKAARRVLDGLEQLGHDTPGKNDE